MPFSLKQPRDGPQTCDHFLHKRKDKDIGKQIYKDCQDHTGDEFYQCVSDDLRDNYHISCSPQQVSSLVSAFGLSPPQPTSPSSSTSAPPSPPLTTTRDTPSSPSFPPSASHLPPESNSTPVPAPTAELGKSPTRQNQPAPASDSYSVTAPLSASTDTAAATLSSTRLPVESSSEQPETVSTMLSSSTPNPPTSSTSSIGIVAGSTSPKPASNTAPSSHPSHTGAIVGGVIAALALLALAIAAFFYIRRRRRHQPPPSAEFMHMARSSSASPALIAGKDEMMPTSPSHGERFVPLVRQSSLEDDELPPAFTPGSYRDPVFEKVSASAAMREKYGGRDVEGGYRD